MCKLRVLIADDDKDLRLLLSVNLAGGGPVEIVGEARDGREAVELAIALRPDLIVMDLMMPVMDGAEATRVIKSQLPSVEIIGFSAADPKGIDRLVRAGANGVFSKEDLEEMLARVEQALSIRNVSGR